MRQPARLALRFCAAATQQASGRALAPPSAQVSAPSERPAPFSPSLGLLALSVPLTRHRTSLRASQKPGRAADAVGAGSGSAPSAGGSRLGARGLLPRDDFIRLLEDALTRLGHAPLAAQLEAATGVALCSPQATALRTAVSAGDWAAASAALAQLPPRDAAAGAAARWLLLRHTLRERLEGGDVAGALKLLRGDMARAGAPRKALHKAAALLLCADPQALADAYAASDDDTSAAVTSALPGNDVAAGRAALLSRLTALLHPSAAVPEGRLEALLEQALGAQLAACAHHNASLDDAATAPLSLLRDHACGPEALPSACCAVLAAHGDEAWHVAFSRGGTMLASGGKDGAVLVHALRLTRAAPHVGATLRHTLRGHGGAVTHVSWSPDDALILSCSADRSARLWNAATGACAAVLVRHADALTAAAWSPDCRTLYTAGLDKRITSWSVPPAGGAASEVTEAASWRVPRVNDLAMAADGSLLAALCTERRVRLWRPADGAERWLSAPSPVTSLALSADGAWLLLCLQRQEVHVWDLRCALDWAAPPPRASQAARDAGEPAAAPCPTAPPLVLRGQGERAGRFVVRACFGGADGAFVASGAEDSQIYVWRRQGGQLMTVLRGHAGCVNAVAWSAKHPGLLASASDDKTLRLWASEHMLAHLREHGE